MRSRKAPLIEVPHTPAACCSVELSSSIPWDRARTPTAMRNTMTKTTDEWPRLNQKPTLIGRWPSAISLRVVLSMAAMWSASNACRMPRVYAVRPRPTPRTVLPTA
jgi:hypothetical protein